MCHFNVAIDALVFELQRNPNKKVSKTAMQHVVYFLVGRTQMNIQALHDTVDTKLRETPESEQGKRYKTLLQLRQYLQDWFLPKNPPEH